MSSDSDRPALHLPARYLAIIQDILRRYLPHAEVWAYGSRVNGDHYDASDLDLVVRQPDDLTHRQPGLDEVAAAFSDSDLPILVQIVDWARIPEAFREEIEAGYVVLQQAYGDRAAPTHEGAAQIPTGSRTPLGNSAPEARLPSRRPRSKTSQPASPSRAWERGQRGSRGSMQMAADAPASLGDFIKVKHGFAFKGEHFVDAPTADVVVTPGNFGIGGGFRTDKVKYYDGLVPEDYILHAGDLIVTMTDLSKAGDTLGYPAIVPHSSVRYLHNQRIGLVQIKEGAEADQRFLYYRLCGQDYRQHILATASGSTVRHTSPGRICEFETELPPLPEQQTIAAVLVVLDDKIEQNRRMAQALERLARAIFRAWFVDFEPVKAKAAGATAFPSMPQPVFDALPTRFVDSDIGPVPEAWEVKALSEVFDINPTRSLRKGEPAPYLDMKSMPTSGHAPDSWNQRPFGSGMRFMNGDTLVARITPCLENGKTAFVDFLGDGQIAWGSTEYIVLRPQPPLPPVFAYCLARTGEFRDFAIQNMTGTSGRQRVSPNAMDHFRLAVPSDEEAVAFGEVVNPMFACIHGGMEESRKLAELRDYLLPKLLSGELRVKDAATTAEERL